VKVAAVLLDLGFHRGSIRLAGASMRERVAGNLIAIAIKPDDLVGIYSGPEAGPLTNQAAGDVENCAPRDILPGSARRQLPRSSLRRRR
jgi:hypothetical protein